MNALILGGTTEARQLAKALGAHGILSLAGTTKNPLGTPARTGGFGGASGLSHYLHAHGISTLIDASHPFAEKISQNAALAAARTGVPFLRLSRPPWPDRNGWQKVSDLPAAAAALPADARVFLSVGSRSLTPFFGRSDIWFLTRSIEAPPRTLHGKTILQRPPFSLAGERALLEAHHITHLVSKNSGGSATRAKLDAARLLGIPVIMVNRPQLPAVFEVATVAEALNWVENQKGTP
ncbi:MAG: cobalt-precorrin-6A reductase [Rhodobacteraceae bacterium]|nr:cobalt-precorrin-6A reductase [Paracoccaceae bacterium]